MSDHRVTVFDEHDNVVGFGVYQGNADMLKSAYFATAEERDRTWRTPEQYRDCACNGAPSSVFVRDDFGEVDKSKPGRAVDACRSCMVLFDTHPDAKYWATGRANQ